jgi:Uma2 family endonuclease
MRVALNWCWWFQQNRHVEACDLAQERAAPIAFTMVIANTRHHVTAAEFLDHPAASGPSELVRGEIRAMTPASAAHGIIAGSIFAALNSFVEERALGICFPDNTGFLLPGLGDTVRSPDASFVSAEKLSPAGIGSGWVVAAPELVVEVLSPTGTASELEAKLRDYFVSGTRLAWVIDPANRTVHVRGPAEVERLLAVGEALDGGDVLPGFALPVERLFARLQPRPSTAV